MKTCKNCGKEIEERAKFCPYCGAFQEEHQAEQTAEGKKETTPSSFEEKADKVMNSIADNGKKIFDSTIGDTKAAQDEVLAFIKNPAARSHMNPFVGAVVIVLSIFAHILLLYAMLYGLMDTLFTPLFSIFGSFDAGLVMENAGFDFFSFFGGGVILTIVVFLFLFGATALEDYQKNGIQGTFGTTAGTLLMPTMMTLLSALLFFVSFLAGTVFLVIAVNMYVVTLLSRLKKYELTYLKVIVITLFVLLFLFFVFNGMSLGSFLPA